MCRALPESTYGSQVRQRRNDIRAAFLSSKRENPQVLKLQNISVVPMPIPCKKLAWESILCLGVRRSIRRRALSVSTRRAYHDPKKTQLVHAFARSSVTRRVSPRIHYRCSPYYRVVGNTYPNLSRHLRST